MRQVDSIILHRKLMHPRDFGAIYEAYYSRVYGYFLHRVGYDHELAADLAQECFLRALRHFTAFKDEGYLYVTYLMTIAHNLLVNYYRKAKAIPWSQIETEQQPDMEEPYDLAAHLERQDLAAAIEHLSPFERRVMAMAYIRGMHVTEIAEHIGKSVAATKLIMFRTRNKIREECSRSKRHVTLAM